MARPALAATRALDIISFLTEHAGEAFTMAQLTRALRLNQGSAHAILTVLADEGFVVRHPVHRTYRLGPALVAVGDASAAANPIVGVARDHLDALAKELGLRALASLRTRRELRVVVRAGQHGSARRVGQRYPLVPPIGVVLVSWAPSRVQADWLDRLPADSGELRADAEALLRSVRRTGYHLGTSARARGALGAAAEQLSDDPHDEHLAARVLEQAQLLARAERNRLRRTDDVATVTVPVLDPDGHAVLEVVVHGFREAPSSDALRQVITATQHACHAISTQMWGG